MVRIIGVLCMVLMLVGVCSGAATVTKSDLMISITGIDADWVWTDEYVSGSRAESLKVQWIYFSPGATDDVLAIEHINASGSRIFPNTAAADAYSPIAIPYYGAKLKPYIDFSDCTLSAGHQVLILLAE